VGEPKDRTTDNGEREEQILREAGERLEPPTMPAESLLDEAIIRGMQRGRALKRRSSFTRLAAAAASILLLAGGLSIRFSPTVAAYVGQLPLLKPFIELLQNDKGLKLAVENDYFQPLELRETYAGTTVSIDGLIADESRILLYVSVQNAPDDYNQLVGMAFKDRFGNGLQDLAVLSSNFNWKEDTVLRGTVDLSFTDGAEVPDGFQAAFKLNKAEGEDKGELSEHVWTFSVPIDTSKALASQTDELQKTITIGGQQITVQKLTLYPTRISVDIAFDPANSKHIFGFERLRIIDENGEELANGTNGLNASRPDDDHITLYFESNYLASPRRLTLKADGIRALDKDKLNVQVDLEQKRILQAPDSTLTVSDIAETPENQLLILKMQPPTDHESNLASILDWSFKDSSGKEYSLNKMGASNREEQGKKFRELMYYLPKENYHNPLTFRIIDYPSLVAGGEIDIQLK